MKELFLILIGSVLVNNLVLARFLGICPFLGVSKRIKTACGMGLAVVFVMGLSSVVTNVIYNTILAPFDLLFLKTVVFILVIATLVQLVEMIIQKLSPTLYQALGIYLPLITTNCAILGVALINVIKDYNFTKSLIFGVGAGAGFTIALIIMAGIRERLELADVPQPLKGAAITLIIAGLLSMAFMGFSGLVKL